MFACSVGVAAPWGSIKAATGVPMGWRCNGPPGFDRPFDRLYIAALLPTATGERKPATALGGADVPLVTHTRVAIVPKGEVFSGWPRTR